jgi:hypothetical protein
MGLGRTRLLRAADLRDWRILPNLGRTSDQKLIRVNPGESGHSQASFGENFLIRDLAIVVIEEKR